MVFFEVQNLEDLSDNVKFLLYIREKYNTNENTIFFDKHDIVETFKDFFMDEILKFIEEEKRNDPGFILDIISKLNDFMKDKLREHDTFESFCELKRKDKDFPNLSEEGKCNNYSEYYLHAMDCLEKDNSTFDCFVPLPSVEQPNIPLRLNTRITEQIKGWLREYYEQYKDQIFNLIEISLVQSIPSDKEECKLYVGNQGSPTTPPFI